MAKGFSRGLGLLVLLCTVNLSTQQDSSAVRSGAEDEQDDTQKSAQAAANAMAQSGLGHPVPVTTPWVITAPTPDPYAECQYQEQLIYRRDDYDECQVCVCVQRYNGYLQPVCGYCNQCPPPKPPTPPTPPPPPPPPPPPEPTCDPFPTNIYFKNPVDPCLICICKQKEIYGHLTPPVIDCQPDPQCVVPTPKPTDNPVIPTTVTPYVCQYYPPNVWFPHPKIPCYMCRCEGGYPNDMTIDCYPDPACEPTTPPTPPTEYPTPYPIPTTTLSPPLPKPHVDPLPGPPPHPSCRPFIPGLMFPHPWDPCLECVCEEQSYGSITNVQVNCYTKAECCYIPPGPNPTPYPWRTTTPFPWYTTTPFPIIRPPPNRGETIGSAQAHANAVATNGAGSNIIGANPQGSHGQADAAAEAAAQAANVVQSNYLNQFPYTPPGQYGGLGQSSAQAQAQAQARANQALAQALADASANSNYVAVPNYYPVQPNRQIGGGYGNMLLNGGSKLIQYPQSGLYQPSNMGYQVYGGSQAQADSSAQAGSGSAQAQADAYAQGDAQAQADAQAQSNSAGYQPWMNNVAYPGRLQSVSDALAQAQANAQSNGYLPPPPPPPSYYGGSAQAQADAYAQGDAQAQADAQAQSNSGYQPWMNNNAYPGRPQSIADALAQANVQNSGYINVPPTPPPPPPSYYGGSAQAQADAYAQGDAQAQADAQAQSNSGYQPWMNNNAYPGRPQSIADALAQANVQNSGYVNVPPTPPPPPPPYYGGSAQAQAQAEADADRGSASAQAVANALAQELAAQAQAAALASASANRGADASAQASASAAASAMKSADSEANAE